MIDVDIASVSRAVCVSLLAIAQQPDDDFRRVAIETLQTIGMLTIGGRHNKL
jgi:hypothetical protein